jgi:hypothetical protein
VVVVAAAARLGLLQAVSGELTIGSCLAGECLATAATATSSSCCRALWRDGAGDGAGATGLLRVFRSQGNNFGVARRGRIIAAVDLLCFLVRMDGGSASMVLIGRGAMRNAVGGSSPCLNGLPLVCTLDNAR